MGFAAGEIGDNTELAIVRRLRLDAGLPAHPRVRTVCADQQFRREFRAIVED
jgi:hypothetical protein